MRNLILCEGHTDAILLSYYLCKTGGWNYSRKSPPGFRIQADDRHGESAEWYRRGDDWLLISAVGSKDSFGRFFHERIEEILIRSGDEAFSRITLMLDRDDASEAELTETVRRQIPLVAGKARCGEWVEQEYQDGYRQPRKLRFLLLAIPESSQGALENVLLDAISEDAYDANIVHKSREFVDLIAPEASRYLGKRRLISKACLGVTWAIQSPQKVFKMIDEQLRGTPWEKSETLRQTFARLLEI